MPVRVPFEKIERPVTQIPEEKVEPIDIPVVDGVEEAYAKRIIMKSIDWLIEKLLYLKKRLRAPLKAPDMDEIEEEK